MFFLKFHKGYPMIDSHSHIGFEELKEDLPALIQRATQQGVERILTVACTYEQLNDLKNILDTYENVYGAFGIHPNESNQLIDEGALTQIVSSHPKIIGIGETGLDYHYDFAPINKQMENFLTHIRVAQNLKKPLIIHARSADEDTIRILTKSAKHQSIKGVLHCFTGTKELAEVALELGFYISASGVITFKKSEELREIFKTIPLDRLLIETDAPYLAPVPYRGMQNEPSLLPHTLRVLADIKGIPVEQMDKITTQNFKKLFSV